MAFPIPPAYTHPGTRSDADDLVVDAERVFDNPFAARIDDVDIDTFAIVTQADLRLSNTSTWLTAMPCRWPARAN